MLNHIAKQEEAANSSAQTASNDHVLFFDDELPVELHPKQLFETTTPSQPSSLMPNLSLQPLQVQTDGSKITKIGEYSKQNR